MPTVLRSGPYSFRFNASEGVEPPHVHVLRDNGEAKFWLNPVRIERSKRFGATQISRIKRPVIANEEYLLGRWNELFNV